MSSTASRRWNHEGPEPRPRAGAQVAGVDDAAVDYGSPFDIAYDMDDALLRCMPRPMAESTAGLPPAPTRLGTSRVRAAVAVCATVLAGVALALALAEALAA